jgi:hypothetical protein
VCVCVCLCVTRWLAGGRPGKFFGVGRGGVLLWMDGRVAASLGEKEDKLRLVRLFFIINDFRKRIMVGLFLEYEHISQSKIK